MSKHKTSTNPTLSTGRWEKLSGTGMGKPMTQNGALQKTFILFVIMVASFFGVTHFLNQAGMEMTMGSYITLAIITLVLVIVACVNPRTAPILAPAYAIIEGTILGSFALYNEYVLEAFVITSAIFFTLLFLYRTRIIRVTNGFVKLIVGLTIGIALFYILELALILLGITDGSLVFGNGIIGLLIAGFCLFVAASNLLVDFRMMEDGANYHLPKYMEWYFGLSLMISIVWVYVEVLRFLSILSDD